MSFADLASQNFLITGGAGLLGRAVARELVMSGASVLLVDHNQDALEALRATLEEVDSEVQIHALIWTLPANQNVIESLMIRPLILSERLMV